MTKIEAEGRGSSSSGISLIHVVPVGLFADLDPVRFEIILIHRKMVVVLTCK